MSFNELLGVVFVVMLSGYLHYLLACAAERRSRSFWMWLVLPLPFSPLLGYIVLRLAGSSRKLEPGVPHPPRRRFDIGAPRGQSRDPQAHSIGWTGNSWFERLMGAGRSK